MWTLARENLIRVLLLSVVTTLAALFPLATAQAQPCEGFGATTPGGSGGDIVHVTKLNDSGPGSLRQALSGGNRTVVFDVAGEIHLNSAIPVLGAFVTVDGFSAESPGITLKGAGLSIKGTVGAHDIIIRGIRIRDAAATKETDSITIASGAHNIKIQNVSLDTPADGNLDVTFGSHDVTVCWSILGRVNKNTLIKFDPSRITLHHNLFIENRSRNPQVRIDDAGTPATDTTLDMRNNVIWDWAGGYGTWVSYGARVNIVANYYANPSAPTEIDRKQAVMVCKGDGVEAPESCAFCGPGEPKSAARAFVSGNVSADKVDVDAAGNRLSPFPAPFVETQDACTAAHLVVANAGARPLDAVDQALLSQVSLPPCDSKTPAEAILDGVHGNALGADAPPASAAEVTSDGFLCYKSATTRGAPRCGPPRRHKVSLADQFEEGTFTVKKPLSLCNPAGIDAEDIPGQDTRLMGYELRGRRHERQSGIRVVNALGEIMVDTIRPDRLLVPSAMNPQEAVDPPEPAGHDIDHYKCYQARVSTGSSGFTPTILSLVDEFDAKQFVVRKPTRLCAPVDKNGEGIKNPEAHLMCYQVRPAAGQPRHLPLVRVHVNNQFGPALLDTIKEEELCVPSSKTLSGG